jgi:DNA-binding XRE family transcriptional regulator
MHHLEIPCQGIISPSDGVDRFPREIEESTFVSEENRSLGSAIRKHRLLYRERPVLSQGELAEMADVHINTVSRIESGEVKDPNVRTLAKLAGRFRFRSSPSSGGRRGVTRTNTYPPTAWMGRNHRRLCANTTTVERTRKR